MKHIKSKKSSLVLILALLMRSLTLFSQQDYPLPVINFQETIWLSADRHLFVPGENVSFNAILFETDTYRRSSLSRILRIELLDSKGNQISRQKYVFRDGKVSQDINLPLTLGSGWYYLRAYTNWMRNFPSTNRSLLAIKVINPSEIESYIKPQPKGTIKVDLVPEPSPGINTTPSRYSLHATGEGGEPVPVRGHFMNGTDSVAFFSTDGSGWTMVESGNISNSTSLAIEGYKKDSLKLEIHLPSQAGPRMSLTESYGSMSVNIVGDLSGHPAVKLVVHGTGTIYWLEKKEPVNGSLIFTVPTSALPQGIVQVTLLDKNNGIISKRLRAGASILAPEPELRVENPNPGYREPNNVKLSLPTAGAGRESNMQIISAREEPENPLETYLPGLPGWPASYEIPADNKAREAWLIATSYPDDVIKGFQADENGDPCNFILNPSMIINDIEGSVRYIPETRGATINGSVYNTSLSEGVSNTVIGLTLLNNNTFLAEKSFASGRFHFVIPPFGSTMDMLLTFIRRPEESQVIRIEPEYETLKPSINARRLTLEDEEVLFLRQLNVDMQLKSIYRPEGVTAEPGDIPSNPEPAFFGTPDRKIPIDRYIKLPNISELIYELVPYVAVKKNGPLFSINVYGETELPPLYESAIMLDGIPFYEYNDFLDLPPDRLRLVEVKNKMYIHGNTGFSGSVIFHSANSDLAGLGLPKKSQLVTVDPPSRSIERSYTIDSSIPASIPQLGNSLLWKEIEGASHLEYDFTTNDNYGNFKVLLFGFNSSGQWTYGSTGFTVGGSPLKTGGE